MSSGRGSDSGPKPPSNSRPGAVSVMPSGLDEQLSEQELADLLAFLEATRRRAR